MAGHPLEAHIRDIPDFPEPGIVFKDITPLLGDPKAFDAALRAMLDPFAGRPITKVVGIEARGFIFGAPIADRLGVGFVPVRKPGKLPWDVRSQEYALEYGTDTLEVHSDAVHATDRLLIVDDVLATGGTARAAVDLFTAAGAAVVGLSVLLELVFLEGRSKLTDIDVHAVVHHDPL